MSQPIYLVRHANAEPRDRWHDDDSKRPLNGKGVRQSRAVADRFQSGPLGDRVRTTDAGAPEARPTRLLSSPATRCVDTLHPLSGALGLPIETFWYLAEGFDPLACLDRLIEVAVADRGVLVACSHGDVIWGLMAELARRGVPLDAPPDARKGSIWALEVEGDTVEDAGVVSGRYIRPMTV